LQTNGHGKHIRRAIPHRRIRRIILARRLFCEIHPVFYQISLRKEFALRRLRDAFSGQRFASARREALFPCIVKSRVYRLAFERAGGKEAGRELILDNHSEVLYDPALIPADQIAGETR
jgi:hypothetical protein